MGKRTAQEPFMPVALRTAQEPVITFALFIALSIGAVVIAGCALSAPKGPSAEGFKAPQEIVPEPQIFFCPTDNCTSVFLDVLAAAKDSIHCALYAINIPSILGLLEERSEKADVRVVIDDENPIDKGVYGKGKDGGGRGGGALDPEFSEISRFSGKGFDFRLDTSSQRSHNKFCVVDNYLVLTGSFNPTVSEEDNLNNVIFFHSGGIAANYEDEFEELWGEDFGKGGEAKAPKVMLNNRLYEIYFCPEDHCAEKVIAQIKKARKSIYFMAFTFTHQGIADALLLRDDIEIRGLIENRQASIPSSQFQRLKAFGIDVKKDAFRETMHHKVFILDNETVITGSFNPTASADKKNDENIVIMHNPAIAKAFAEEFFRLFSA